MALVVLARHHHGAGRPPARAGRLVEDVLVRDYLAAAEDRLRAAGHEVILVSGVSYEAGRQVARERKAAVYVAGHVNAGPAESGTYGLLVYDHRSTAGEQLARECATPLFEARVRASTRPNVVRKAGHPDDWSAAAYALIADLRRNTPVCLVYEPGFIDQAGDAWLWSEIGLRAVGVALADGILTYLEKVEAT